MLIRKDGTTLNVTRGAYLSLFANQGWEPTNEPIEGTKTSKNDDFMAPKPKRKAPTHKKVSSDIPFSNIVEEEVEDDEDYDLVLEDMTVKELVEYADEKGVDIEGLSKKADLIKAIKKELGE